MRERFDKEPNFFRLADVESPDRAIFVNSGHVITQGNESIAEALPQVLGPQIESLLEFQKNN